MEFYKKIKEKKNVIVWIITHWKEWLTLDKDNSHVVFTVAHIHTHKMND